jgi:hypothetical protein
VAEEQVRADVTESLEDLSGEWMRQQLQDAEVAAPPSSPRSGEPSVRHPEPLGFEPRPSLASHRAESALDSSVAAATQTPASSGGWGSPATGGAEQDPVLAELARSVSQAVVGAVSNLERNRAAETQSLRDASRRHEEQLRAVTERLASVQSKLDQFVVTVSDQKSLLHASTEKYTELAALLETLRLADVTRETTLEELRRETLDLSVSVSDRQDQVVGRLELQQADLAEIKGRLSDLTPKIDTAFARLDRQSQVIRSLLDAERRREAALQQLSDAASSLRSASPVLPDGLSEELL